MLVYSQDFEKLSDFDYLYLKNVLNQPFKDGLFYDELIRSWKELNEKDSVNFA